MMDPTLEKIIFTGPVGAGKTAAIAAISDVPPVSTDVACQGDERRLKATTTVAMDYSYIDLGDGRRVHLYGTPGQARFDFMWELLTRNGLGLVLLINNDHPEPLSQLDFYLDAFADFIARTGVVIGITRMGLADQARLEDYQNPQRSPHFLPFYRDGIMLIQTELGSMRWSNANRFNRLILSNLSATW